MNDSLALAAQRLQRAAYARFLFIGQRDEVDAQTVAPIDHQLVAQVNGLRAAYLAAGGSEADADEVIKTGLREATAKLDR